MLGVVEGLEEVISQHGIDQIIIAMPQASREEMDWIWRTSTRASASVKVMPDLGEFLSEGTIKLRELQIEDLLGREPVDIDLEALSGYVNGKRVLVTGAAGSIGSELSRQISRLGPAKLVLMDRDESGLYYLNAELRREDFYDSETFIGDVTNPERVSFVFEKFRPQLVFHAAAYKHVPMMELQATECITNNVYGTLNVARAAGAYGANKFVNVSTDNYGLAELAKRCHERGMAFVAVVEYQPGARAGTYYMTEHAGLAMHMQHFCAMTAPNVDAYVMNLKRHCKAVGQDMSGSFVLRGLGA